MHISKIKSGPKKYSLAHDVPWENPEVSTSCSHGIIQFFSPLASFLLEALCIHKGPQSTLPVLSSCTEATQCNLYTSSCSSLPTSIWVGQKQKIRLSPSG